MKRSDVTYIAVHVLLIVLAIVYTVVASYTVGGLGA
jgi:hypothetical protein